MIFMLSQIFFFNSPPPQVSYVMLSHIVTIITGGASGLGAATAACLVRHGARVVIADLPVQKNSFLRLAATVSSESARINAHKGSMVAFAEIDVMNEDQVKEALDMAEREFGQPGKLWSVADCCAVALHFFGLVMTNIDCSPKVNALVNCAGIAPAKKTLSKNKGSPIDGSGLNPHPLDLFSNTMMINAVGSFNVARLAAERMCLRDVDKDGLRGCIINTASVAAYEGQIGQVAYAASKGAIVAMTLPMARDLSPFGIRVMTIVSGNVLADYFLVSSVEFVGCTYHFLYLA
jgi:3-hydroxyacyl-CoA dehydrogenase / 3-hydroxy-2-methylbutyryl-CoA dehydrogenase